MFSESYDYVVSLFNEVAQLIGGQVVSRFPGIVKIIKDTMILEYQFGDRDDLAHFLFIMPFDLKDMDFSIERKRGKIATAWLDGHMKEILDFTVAANNEYSKSFMVSLFNDYQFKNSLASKIGDWKIEYKDQTLTFMINRDAQPIFGKKLSAQDLKDIYELIIEFKDASSYHFKRI